VLRFYLTGRVGVEGRTFLDQAELPGRQGRLALVHLVVERHHPVAIDALAAALWGTALPPSWEPSLRAVISKLRRSLLAVDEGLAIASDAGCYQLLAGDAWIDVDAAVSAVDRAEGALRRGERAEAWSEATVAAGIAARPVLPGEDLPWVGSLRGRVRSSHIRALDVLARLSLADRRLPLAIAFAEQLVALEPFRETSFQHLMRAQLAAGNRGEAVRVYGGLRDRLRDELGVDPSAETQAVYLEALRAGDDDGR
jgi:SARP family transcriptional regulator, regulator of embCAB operon